MTSRTARGWKARFTKLLRSSSKGDWEAAFALKSKHLPHALCQYRRFDSNGHWASNLRNMVVRMSPAKSFNDPFDCSLSLDMAVVLGDAIRHRLAASPPPFLDATQAKSLIDGKEDGFALFELMRALELQALSAQPSVRSRASAPFSATEMVSTLETKAANVADRYQEQIAVSCFTTTSTHLTMWSHYSDYHRGLCVAFDLRSLAEDDDRRRYTFPVCYEKARLDIGSWIAHSRPKAMLKFIAATNKSPHWAYEDEWRLVDGSPSHFGGHFVKMPRPVAIYLGCRTSNDNREQARALASELGIPIHLMTLHPKEYQLDARPL
jgi:hypothetical protein